MADPEWWSSKDPRRWNAGVWGRYRERRVARRASKILRDKAVEKVEVTFREGGTFALETVER